MKYSGKEHALHLKVSLESKYKVIIHWDGKLYVVISPTRDSDKGTVRLSIPGYLLIALYSFLHENPKRGQDLPYPWTPLQYGNNNRILNYKHPDDKLDAINKKHLHKLSENNVLYMSNWLNHVNGTQLPSGVSQKKKHLRVIKIDHTFPELLYITSRLHKRVQEERYYPDPLFRWFSPLRTWGIQESWRILFPRPAIKKSPNIDHDSIKWAHAYWMHHTVQHHGLFHRSWIRMIDWKLSKRNLNANHSSRNVPQTTTSSSIKG